VQVQDVIYLPANTIPATTIATAAYPRPSRERFYNPLAHRARMARGNVDDEFIEAIVSAYVRGLP